VGTATGLGVSPSVTVSSSTNELVVDALYARYLEPSIGTGQTVKGSTTAFYDSNMRYIKCSEEAGASSVTMSWSLFGAMEYALISVPLVTCSTGDWDGGTSTDWNTTTNWCNDVIPTSGTNVTILNEVNDPVIGAFNAVCGDLTIESGAVLTVNNTNASYDFDIYGNIYNSGTITHSGNQNIELNGSSKTISNTGTMTTVKVDVLGSASYTASSNLTFDNLTISASGTFDASTKTISISGDFANSGVFTDGSSTISLSGSSNQNLDSDNDNMKNVTINKSGGSVYLTGNTTIAGALTFSSNTLLYMGNYNLLFTNNGSVSGATSSRYLVCSGTGVLQQQNVGSGGRTGGILFPVGISSSSYTPITINNSTGTADRFEVFVCDKVYTDGNCSGGTQITADALGKTWKISEQVAGGSSADITFQWNLTDELTDFDRTASYISHYNTGTSQWEKLQTAGAASGANPYTRTVTGVNSFSPFGGGSGSGGPLPIILSKFGAEIINEKVYITWSTLSENNNDYFTIERSVDGINFSVLEIIPGAGKSSAILNYEVIDTHPYEGTSYYRLKQTDYDGGFKYSKLVAVNNVITFTSINFELGKITPNPVNNNEFSINILHASRSSLLVNIFSLNGELVYSKVYDISKGLLNVLVQPEVELGNGSYLVVLENGNQLVTKRLVVGR
jgi:hypothetical protein